MRSIARMIRYPLLPSGTAGRSCCALSLARCWGPGCYAGEPLCLERLPAYSSAEAFAALLRDCKAQESEAEEHEQGLKDDVHLRIGKVIEAEDPMDLDNIEAQDKANARECAQEE